VYAVDDYVNFVQFRPSRRLRHRPRPRIPTDVPRVRARRLRGNVDVVAAELAQEVAQRVTIAGVEIVEVRHQPSRLRPRDRAGDAAPPAGQRRRRRACSEGGSRGSVGMVEMALARLEEHGIVELDEERKGGDGKQHLLVVLCAEPAGLPV